jgi:hypothetical protein
MKKSGLNLTHSRRHFLMGGGALLGGALLAKNVFADKKPETKSGPDVLVDEKSTLAATLKLYQDGSKVPAGIRQAKSGVDGPKQACNNCMFYAKVKGEKDAEIGKCQLFVQGNVKAKGWCTSWTKKA